jgi:glutathione S-transferase
LKLYGSHRSPYVQKVRVFIREKGVACDFLDVRPASAEVVALNPLSQIPTLELDNGSGIFDSTVIVDYIDGAWPERPLIPQTFAERIEVRRWEALCDGMAESARMITHELSVDAASRKGADYFGKHQGKIDRGMLFVDAAIAGRKYCVGNSLTLADVAFAAAYAYIIRNMPDTPVLKQALVAHAHADALFVRPSFSILL